VTSSREMFIFEIPLCRSIKVETRDEKVVLEFEEPSALFALVEDLGILETQVLTGLGYGEMKIDD